MIIRKVPETLRREFKALCANEGKSMKGKIIELMSGAVVQKKGK
jgi:phage terminase Nu1 subunit (DNA packaging protein)